MVHQPLIKWMKIQNRAGIEKQKCCREIKSTILQCFLKKSLRSYQINTNQNPIEEAGGQLREE